MNNDCQITKNFSSLEEVNLYQRAHKQEKLIEELQQLLREKEKVLSEKEATILEKEKIIAQRDERIRLLLRHQYCSRSEKLKADQESGQLSLFDEASAPIPEEPEPTTAPVKGHQRKKGGGGRRALPKALLRIRREYALTADERQCGHCGEMMEEIGGDLSEQLEIIPALMYVIQHIKKKYACKQCEEGVKQATSPRQPIAKSQAGPGLLAHVIVSKFCDSLPLYRQESILKRSGVDLKRSSLCQWVSRCAHLLSPLVDLMRERLLTYDIAFADETTVQVLKEQGRRPQKKSYMWVFSGGPPDQFGIVYRYYPGRHGVVATDFFEGYSGYLHADGYSGYNPICSLDTTHVGCWAHTRRKFVEVIKGMSKGRKPGLADEALARIGQLYQIEKQAKAEQLSPDQIYSLRQKAAKPIVDALKPWLEEYKLKTSAHTAIHKAIAYTLNRWQSLQCYLEDGRLHIDNNYSERLMKAFAVGRKNWLFYDQVKGAKAGAILYSLIETCKHHGMDPYLWMRYALKMMPQASTQQEVKALLPYHCDPLILKQDLENDRKRLTSELAKKIS